MKYFLDTNICIYFLKGIDVSLKQKFRSITPDDIKISSIVKAELLYGAEKSLKKEANYKTIHQFLFPFEIVGFTDNQTQVYARIRASLEKRGTIIGPNDLILSATVISHEGILVTNNTNEFKRVQDLKIENWLMS